MMSNDNFMFDELIDDDNDNTPEFIPLMSNEAEEDMSKEPLPATLPILPLRNTVLFPGVVIPITIGRDKSIKLIKESYKKDKIIGAVSQKDSNIEDPTFADLNSVGTVANIIKMLRMPDGNTMVIIQGKRRFNLENEVSSEPFFVGSVKPFVDRKDEKSKEFNALISSIRDMALRIIDINPNIPSEAGFAMKNISSPRFLVNFISSNMNLELVQKQAILAMDNLADRAKAVIEHLTKELQMLEMKMEIQSKVRGDMDKQQREYFLNQQLRQIQEELGQDSPDKELLNLREKGKEKKWHKDIAEAFNKELDKLQRMNNMSPDFSVGLNYAQVLLDLPWNEFTVDKLDLKRARRILDEDHFGMEKVKQRILEYLAVLKLKGDMKSPILCLFGPPGVGKTSLGKSIAKSIGRKYVRMSLGGLHDEAEIRGHRKTYIGAMPGRVIQSLKKAKSANPVFILDEIDKVGRDTRGDVSSALLELLDPEQNNAFYDNYIELEFDLSRVMFIATANSLDTIQPALLDRMEIIDLSGYTLEEKIEIAKKHLISKQREAHGLNARNFKVTDAAVRKVVEGYTRESGVRGLDKKIAALARGQAKEIVIGNKPETSIGVHEVSKLLGAEKVELETYQDNDVAGVVTGLAWTPVGGEILFIESILTKGRGGLKLTGQLGDVMKESASTALTYLKSHSSYLKIEPEVFNHWDIHIHVPAGAVPKDGPSAGVTMLTSLASLFTQRKVKKKLAMTGEITLRGKVLPIGGVKEKILAARRAGITEIILCITNERDVKEIPDHYLEGLQIHYVTNMLEVLDLALTDEKVENPLDLKPFEPKKKIGFGMAMEEDSSI
ncbi:MAG: endopeptidase La [Bacteroidota bacterium]|nr:endopeptidase La [Bacteroidota bacterium]